MSPLVSPLTVHEPEAPVTVQVWEPLAAVVVSVAVTRDQSRGAPVSPGGSPSRWPLLGRAGAGHRGLGAPGVPGMIKLNTKTVFEPPLVT